MTIFVPSTALAPNTKTLAQYIVQVRRLLHDSTGTYWPDSELTDYINSARNRLVADTGCYRKLQTGSVTQAQETYEFSVFGQTDTFDVLSITLLWGLMRVPMTRMPFTEFNLKMRAWQSFQSRPIAFSVYGGTTIYVGPIPDQTYSVELDTVVAPDALVLTTNQDFLAFPFVDCIAFYAAYLAKFKEQSYDEAARFEAEYARRVREAVRSSFTRLITHPF